MAANIHARGIFGVFCDWSGCCCCVCVLCANDEREGRIFFFIFFFILFNEMSNIANCPLLFFGFSLSFFFVFIFGNLFLMFEH